MPVEESRLMSHLSKEPSPATVAAIAEAKLHYPLDDVQDFTDAGRGLIAPLPGAVTGSDGHVIYDPAGQSFVSGEAPDSVDASLWRQSQLITQGGLYQVVDGARRGATARDGRAAEGRWR
ncbi:hypothetical protein ACFT30_10640 [Microbacterium ureisolvens]|uniref:hypothetical protein n=1 Tax=Microbacterium ureisolvens TaxID=2781186 RepID=UPI00362C68AB